MNSKNVIELNGNRYNALNGQLLGPVVHAASTIHKPKQAVPRNVDGVFRSTLAKTRKETPTVAPTAAPTVVKPATISSAQHHTTVAGANHTSAHKPQSAKTLMRTAVQKPGPGFKKQINVQAALQTTSPSLIVKKTSVYSTTPQRISTAKSVPQSPHISRYGEKPATNLAVSIAPLAVQAPPSRPLVTPAPAPDNKPSGNIFEQAVANATNFVDTKAQKVQFKKKARGHVLSMAGGSLALLALAGFIAYQHVPALQLKVAGYQAGFGVTMPDFKAAGFTWGGVSSQSGKIIVGLTGQHGGKYQLSQTPTNWTSDDMIQNISSIDASGYPNYTTLQAGTTTVYRFNSTSATWIKNGTWFQLTSTNSLSDTQVKTLAAKS